MSFKKIADAEENLVKVLYARDLTGPAIASRLNISVKQVYDSLRRQGIPRKSLLERNRQRFLEKPLSFVFKEEYSLEERDLLVAGLMLYYGEGTKTGNTVDFANSDPMLLLVFLKFLRIICSIDTKKLRFYLYCFSDQDSESSITFWCSHLGVQRRQFTKPYVRSTLNKGKRTMKNGVSHIRYSG
jgi:transcriptional regulator with XRE-family HTH domain